LGLGYECGVGQHKQETQLHNQEISVQGTAGRSISPGNPSRGSKSGAGMGVFSSGEGGEYTTVTQRWAVQDLWVQEININKELTRCIQMVIIKVH